MISLLADCTWDYFSCTNRYGRYPDNKLCCDMRFKQCCMVVMNPTTTHRPPVSNYGPGPIDIDLNIESDLNIPDLENPIDDIDIGEGQVVNRPEVAASTAEVEPGSAFLELCSAAALKSSDMAAHPEDCSKFLSCQRGGEGGWLATVRECSHGTVWDPAINQCNYRQNVPSCQAGASGQSVRISTVNLNV